MNVDLTQDIGGGSHGTSVSLTSRGRQIATGFSNLQAKSIEDRLSSGEHDALGFEIERFHVWANSIGLLHQGHSSLDYRLRDAGKLSAYIEKLLVDLEQTLKLLVQYCLDDQQPSAENASDRSDTSDESEDRDDGTKVLITEIVEINDRLYKFATQVRNPKARLYSAKAQKFCVIDPESGFDLIQLYRNIDKEHIYQIFLSLRNGPLTRSQEGPSASEKLKDPKFTKEDEVLISRLATANTHRRQQFGQWREHQMTIINETNKELNDHDTNPVSKPSTATALLNPGAIRLDDNVSTTSGMTISPSARSSVDEEVEIPDPPKVPPRAKHFTCPYCFYLCSISTLKKAAWREHVLRDLRPYVCTYPDCNEGDQLYDRWKDWASHEQWKHRKTWYCIYHPSLDFKTVEDFKHHWQTDHRDQMTSPDEAAHSNVTVSQASGRLCPICRCESKSADSLLQHIATHLQRIALFALPKYSGGDDDDSQQENAGSTSQVQADDRDSIFANESITWSGSDQVEDSKSSLSNALTKEALGALTSRDAPENWRRAAFFLPPRRDTLTFDHPSSEDERSAPEASTFDAKSLGFNEHPTESRSDSRSETIGNVQRERGGQDEQDVKGKQKEEGVIPVQVRLETEAELAERLKEEKALKKKAVEEWKLKEVARMLKEKKEKEGKDEEFRERMRKTLWADGYSDEQIERMIKKADKEDSDFGTIKCICNSRADDGNTILCETCDTWQHIKCYYKPQNMPGKNDVHNCVDCDSRQFSLQRPTYVKAHRKHLDPETLNTYELPWKWDDEDPDYIIIEKWIPEHEQDTLFEHTRKLRNLRDKKGLVLPGTDRASDYWSSEDDARLMQHRAQGTNWGSICAHFPGRTANACRERHELLLESENLEQSSLPLRLPHSREDGDHRLFGEIMSDPGGEYMSEGDTVAQETVIVARSEHSGVITTDLESYPKRGKTTIPTRSVDKEVLVQLGYPFEEEGEIITILRALSEENIEEIVSLSKGLDDSNKHHTHNITIL